MTSRTAPRPSSPPATIGSIGAGKVGSQNARAAVSAGCRVVIANSRGPGSLKDPVARRAPRAGAATAAQTTEASDLVVIAAPLKRANDMPAAQLANRIVLDTNGCMPWRDGRFTLADSGEKTVHGLRQEQLPTSKMAKAFTRIPAPRLFLSAGPAGAPGRHPLSVSGNCPEPVRLVAEPHDRFGFDTADNSPLREAWRSGPGQPAWVAHEHRPAAGVKADPARTRPVRRA